MIRRSGAVVVRRSTTIDVTRMNKVSEDRLNGGHPCVANEQANAVIARQIKVGAYVSRVAAGLRPLLYLVINFRATYRAFRIEAFDSALVSGVAWEGVREKLFVNYTRQRIMFLARANARSRVFPVVQDRRVIASFVVRGSARYNIKVGFAILASRRLPVKGYVCVVSRSAIKTGRVLIYLGPYDLIVRSH